MIWGRVKRLLWLLLIPILAPGCAVMLLGPALLIEDITCRERGGFLGLGECRKRIWTQNKAEKVSRQQLLDACLHNMAKYVDGTAFCLRTHEK